MGRGRPVARWIVVVHLFRWFGWMFRWLGGAFGSMVWSFGRSCFAVRDVHWFVIVRVVHFWFGSSCSLVSSWSFAGHCRVSLLFFCCSRLRLATWECLVVFLFGFGFNKIIDVHKKI